MTLFRFLTILDSMHVVVELFGAIHDPDARLFADELAMRALVNVLKPAPPTYVIDQDAVEAGFSSAYVLD
jgi:hypothetical protein